MGANVAVGNNGEANRAPVAPVAALAPVAQVAPVGLPDGVGDAPAGYQNLIQTDQGGFAVVYRALDTRFDRTVALKILRSDSLDERQLRRFSAECLAIGRVSSHPNIVTVYDAGITGGHRPWLAMEYCSGGSLAHKVATHGPLPVAEVISIGARLCDALSAAHGAGILHRDVKPHNVLITSYGEPALADFGIASVHIEGGVTRDTASESGLSGSSTAYTVVHAAPEILEGKAGTAAADIYSLGSTLYTLLAGAAPFATEAGIGLAPLVASILRNDLPVIARPGVPPALEQLLRRSMAARPQDRPGSAAELGASLASLGQRVAGEERPVSAALPPMAATRLLLTLAGTLGLLLAAFMASGFTFQGSQPVGIRPGARWLPTSQASAQVPADTGTDKGAAAAARGADGYVPKGLVVAQGQHLGELIITWLVPTRPEVIATVVYQGPGVVRARAVLTYKSSANRYPRGTSAATLHGLPAGQQVCLTVANVVSTGGRVTNVLSHPVCAVPR